MKGEDKHASQGKYRRTETLDVRHVFCKRLKLAIQGHRNLTETPHMK